MSSSGNGPQKLFEFITLVKWLHKYNRKKNVESHPAEDEFTYFIALLNAFAIF